MMREGRWSPGTLIPEYRPDDDPVTLADAVDLVDLVGRPLLALVDGRWLRVRLVDLRTHGTPPTAVDVALVVEGPVVR